MGSISLGVMVAKITGRLLTSGCSYTASGPWSSWADILSSGFETYKNLGEAGCDNATVARSVIGNAQCNDTVVIMWTSYDRWSFYDEKGHSMVNGRTSYWTHAGALALNKPFFADYYHPVERFQTTLDYIMLVDLHSRVNNYQAYHFNAFFQLTGENYQWGFGPEPDVNGLGNIYNKIKGDIKNNYLEDISMEQFRLTHFDLTVNHRYSRNDSHPTPLCHWEYVEKIMAPRLNIALDQNLKQNIIQEQENLVKYGKTIR